MATRRGGQLRYVHTDHLGSSSLETTESGADVSSSYIRHWAYGAVRLGNPAVLQTDRTFTGQKSDDTGLLYMNARYYDPSLGQFLSPDTIVPDAGNVFDYNRYMYARGNPIKYNDPSGHCPAPGADSGSVICIDLFIGAEFTDPMHFGYGDNRTYSSDSPPEKSRGYIYLYLDDDGVLVNSEAHFGVTHTQAGSFGPYEEYNHYWVNQDEKSGEISVTWDLKNGFSGRLLSLSDEIYGNEAAIGSFPGGSTAIMLGSSMLPNINGTVTIGRVGAKYDILEMNRDPYPSLEIYYYENGTSRYDIELRPEHGWGPFYGLNPVAKNEVIRRR